MKSMIFFPLKKTEIENMNIQGEGFEYVSRIKITHFKSISNVIRLSQSGKCS